MGECNRKAFYAHQRDVLQSALIALVTLFGAWSLLITTFPFGILTLIILIALLCFIRIPPPDQKVVETVLGKDPYLRECGFKLRSVAHRGAGFDAPENSIEAIKLCHENGIQGVELDISLTADGVPVVCHDNNLERLSNVPVDVRKTKWEDLSKIDIGFTHPFKDRFPNTHIPTLEDAVKQLLCNGQRIIFDLKDNETKLIPNILELYKKYPELYDKAVVSSFYPHLIYLIRRKDPKIIGSLAWRPCAFSHEFYSYLNGIGPRRYKQLYKHYLSCCMNNLYQWALPKIVYYLVGVSLILLHRDVASGELIMKWRSRGVRVMCWSINTPIEKQFCAKHLRITYLTDTATSEETSSQCCEARRKR